MFDTKTYKDDWTPPQNTNGGGSTNNDSQSNSSASTIGDLSVDDKAGEKKGDFHEFDGTKTNVAGNIADKYNGLSFDEKKEEKPATDEQDIDKLADEIIGRSEPKTPIKNDLYDNKEEGIAELEKSVEHDMAEEKTDGLEGLLNQKSSSAISKLENAKKEKKETKDRLDREISEIDEKIKELNSLTEELKGKLQKFDDEVSDLK